MPHEEMSPNEPFVTDFSDLSQFGISPTTPFSSPQLFNTTNNGLVMDTVTGQVMTIQQAFEIDPQGFMASFGMDASPFGVSGTTDFSAGLPTSFGGPGAALATLPPAPALGGLLGNNPMQTLSLLAVGGTALLGLAGVIQKAAAGDEEAKTKVRNQLAAASPEEQQAIQLALQAATEGFQRQQAQHAALEASLSGDLSKLLSQQAGIGEALAPTAAMMARGILPISPELEATVEQAFSPQLGDTVALARENAMRRGFSGKLFEGPTAAIAAPLLAQLQGDIARAKLNTALGLPVAAGEMMGMFTQPAAMRLQGFSALENLNQQMVDSLGGIAGVAQRPRIAGAEQTQTQQRPTSLLEALGPMAGLLGGVGGALGGVAAMQQAQQPRPQPMYISMSGAS